MKQVLDEIMEVASEVVAKETSAAQERVARLKALGFTSAVSPVEKKLVLEEKLAKVAGAGYLRITRQQIEAFLERKVKAYNEQEDVVNRKMAREKKKDKNGGLITISGWGQGFVINGNMIYGIDPTIYNGEKPVEPFRQDIRIQKETHDYQEAGKSLIGKYVWLEQPIENVKAVPPEFALERLQAAKDSGVFEYYTIARLESLPDPILFGRIEGSEDRFVIAQWDNDITLDDLI